MRANLISINLYVETMSQNPTQNVSRIFQEIFSILNKEKPSDCLKALEKSLSTLLVLYYPKDQVKNIVIQLCKDVVKEYHEIHSSDKGY